MRCESGSVGGYRLSTTGNGYWFAYQFNVAAWVGSGGRFRGGRPVGRWSTQPGRLEQSYRAVVWDRKSAGDPWPNCPLNEILGGPGSGGIRRGKVSALPYEEVPMHDVVEAVVAMLEKLANGEAVELGEFSDNASGTTAADLEADALRELAAGLRSGVITVG
jgi:hypothetical protein